MKKAWHHAKAAARHARAGRWKEALRSAKNASYHALQAGSTIADALSKSKLTRYGKALARFNKYGAAVALAADARALVRTAQQAMRAKPGDRTRIYSKLALDLAGVSASAASLLPGWGSKVGAVAGLAVEALRSFHSWWYKR